MKWNNKKKLQKSSNEKDWNSVLGIQNPRRETQNPRLSWIPSHGEKQRDRKFSTFLLAVLLHQQGSDTSWTTFPCSFFGPNLHDFDFLFSTSWLIMARPTLAIPPSRNCANYKKWDVAKERLLLSFILSKGYKVKFLKSFAKKGMYLMRSWRNTLDWKLSHQKIRRRLL